MKTLSLLLALISINIALAGWSEPVLVGTTEYEAYPEIQARHDSLFVIYEDKFVRSLDGGQTWQDQHVFENTIFLRDSDFQINGDTLVVFNGGDQYQFFFSTDFGETWQGPRGCGYFSPGMQFISLNYLHNLITVCYSEYYSEYLWTIHLISSNDFGVTWAEPESIWVDSGGIFPKLYFYNGEPLIIYELEQGFTDSDVYFLHQVPGGFWADNYLFDGSGTTSKNSLALSSEGKVAAVYEDANYITLPPSRVLFRASSDTGNSWDPEVDLSEGDRNCDPKISITGDTVVVVWNTETQLVCRRSFDLGQTWQPLEVLNPEGIGEGHVDVDIENGKIRIVFFRGGTSSIWYQYWEPETYIDETDKPEAYSLSKVYPNPFNNQTIINYTLDQPSYVAVQIYDVLGREISTLIQKHQPPGKHRAIWHATDQPSGIYFVKINTDVKLETYKVVLLK